MTRALALVLPLAASAAAETPRPCARLDGRAIAIPSTEAGAALGALRAIRLAAHLETAPLLTRHRIHLYAQARGYAGGHAHGRGRDGK